MKKAKADFQKGNVLILALLVIIMAFIGYECYSVTHIELKTQQATVSTVYNKIDATALVVRQEEVIANPSSNVVVPCLNDGEKINVKGNVAMCFSSDEEASNYAKYVELNSQLDYYKNLQSQSVGHAADLEKINQDIDQKVLDYAYGLENKNSEVSGSNLNSVLVRRQILIGEKVDLASHIKEINDQLSSLKSQPQSYITTEKSGVFSTYTDGYENLVDFDNIDKVTLSQYDSFLKSAKKKKETKNTLGKLVTGYQWYLLTKVNVEDIKGIENGNYLKIAFKNDNSKVYKMEVVAGAEVDFGKKETLLVLKCNEMSPDLAQYRCEDIEIRKDSIDGFKVPFDAVHVNEDKKGVYVLIASEVKFREINILYSDDDYVLVEYDPENSKGIHLYDQIIIQGKDLEDGKVYT